jgi:hypothetical protein
MPDLETQLRTYGTLLDERHPNPTFDEIVEGPRKQPAPVRPLRLRRGLAIAVASAVIVLILVGGLALLLRLFVEEEAPVVTTPEPPPVETSEWPLGLTVVGEQGVSVVPFDALDQPILLQSDELLEGIFERINWAISDHRGGLIFEHDVIPDERAAVLWLRAGAAAPELLVPESGIFPIGVTTSAEQHALFVYSIGSVGADGWRSRIMAADLDQGGTIREIGTADGGIEPLMGDYHASAADGVVAVFDLDWAEGQERCITVTLIGVDDGSTIPATGDCLPFPGGMTLSYDGQAVGVISQTGESVRVAVMDVFTGAILEENIIDVQTPHEVGLVSSPGGWLIYAESDAQIRLLRVDGSEWKRIEKASVPMAWPHVDFWFFKRYLYHHPFNLASEASLGSGTGELPCQATTADLPAQDLPNAVAVTRQLLFDLAVACDYEGLAAIVWSHNTQMPMFDSIGSAPPPEWEGHSEDDMVRSWVADGRRGREPLSLIAAMLQTQPSYVEDIPDWPVWDPGDHWVGDPNPDPEGCVWVWESGGNLLGIDTNGVWRFFIPSTWPGPGDEPGGPQPPSCSG